MKVVQPSWTPRAFWSILEHSGALSYTLFISGNFFRQMKVVQPSLLHKSNAARLLNKFAGSIGKFLLLLVIM